MLDISGTSAISVGVTARWYGDGRLPVEYPGLDGGVKVKRSSGKLVASGRGWEMTPNRDMSSKGEAPRILNDSSVSAGGEPKLDMDESVQEEA